MALARDWGWESEREARTRWMERVLDGKLGGTVGIMGTEKI